jgi:hypothetical protein
MVRQSQARFDSLAYPEHLLPGFRYPLLNLFKEWDWE